MFILTRIEVGLIQIIIAGCTFVCFAVQKSYQIKFMHEKEGAEQNADVSNQSQTGVHMLQVHA